MLLVEGQNQSPNNSKNDHYRGWLNQCLKQTKKINAYNIT